MCICVCLYFYMCEGCTYVVFAPLCVNVYVGTCVCLYLYVHECVYVCTCVFVPLNVCTCVHVCLYL